MNLTIGVVLTTNDLERISLLREAIDSVRHQTRLPDEVIVVLEPDLHARISSTLDGVRVVKSTERGLAASRDTGLHASSCDVCAFIDDDAVACPEWLEQLAQCYDDESVVAAGGPVMPKFEAVPPAWYSDYLLWAVGCTYPGHRTARGSVDRLIGCNMSFKRSMLIEAGGFDEALGRRDFSLLSGEDTEACWRLQEFAPQKRIAFEPSAIVRHRVSANRMRTRYMLLRSYAGGRSLKSVRRRFPSKRLEAEDGYVRALIRGTPRFGRMSAELFFVLFSSVFVMGFILPAKWRLPIR